MKVIPTVHAEPRTTVNAPAYRVHFWERPAPDWAWNLDAHVLTEAADIVEVLSWVDDNARGRRVEVFVEMDEMDEMDKEPQGFHVPRECGLLRLLGSDPNDPDNL